MAWIESHQTLKDHPKLYKIMDILGIDKAQAIGHLHLFWWWCVDYAPEGVLKDYNDLQVARAAEWSGEPKMFCNALVTAGFFDRDCGVLTVHDWQEFRLHYDLMLDRKERQLEQTRERVKAFREKKRNCNATVTQCNADTKPTKPNQTNIIYPPEKPAGFSKEFVEKAEKAKERGFNIYQLSNAFYKQSKLCDKLPEAVLSAVLDEFESRGESVEEHWPYFLRVLQSKSAQHFANKSIGEKQEFKDNFAFSVADIFKSMVAS